MTDLIIGANQDSVFRRLRDALCADHRLIHPGAHTDEEPANG